jgi:glycosyltransferase involved in cell wall biosynthesis
VRVAIVPPTPTPYREPLFEQLSRRFELTVIYQSSHEPGWDAPVEWFPFEHPYPFEHLPSWQRRRAGRTPIVWPRGLERALDRSDPACVVAWEYGPASLRVFRWCRRRRRRFVIFTECTTEIDRLLGSVQLHLHRWLARRADALIVASSQARERLRSFGVADERIALGIQSADVTPFRAVAPSRGERPLTILTVGRLVPDKNVATLLEAWAQARVSPEEGRLEIVGTGFLADELRTQAEQLGVPARFAGHVAPERLPQLLARTDVFALVSTYEPFGVVVREAAATGLPIVCSRLAGAAGDAAIDGRNALLVDPRRADEIANAIRRLLDDDELRRRMGEESLAVEAALEGRDVQAFEAAIAPL